MLQRSGGAQVGAASAARGTRAAGGTFTRTVAQLHKGTKVRLRAPSVGYSSPMLVID